MKVIIAGSRSFNDYRYLCAVVVMTQFDMQTVISGRAQGADRLGERWAREHDSSLVLMPADWKRYGKGAGHLRNEAMAKVGEGLIALWDGISPGTKSMIMLARKHKLDVRVFTTWAKAAA